MAGQNKEGAESMKRYKIMIIEDDPVIQGELQTLLNGNGYATIGIKDFSAVIEQIQDEKPHLILLDIKLPGENGFALCSKIRTFSEVPIIFVTSCNTDMDELNSIMLGGDAFITKPYNTAILLAKIASLLKKAYPAQQREQIVYGDVVLHLESSSLDYHGHCSPIPFFGQSAFSQSVFSWLDCSMSVLFVRSRLLICCLRTDKMNLI